MKILDTIRPGVTEEISAEGEDYMDVPEKLLVTVPKGYTLLHVRREA